MLIGSQIPQTIIGQVELSSVKNDLVQATIKWIQEISQKNHEAVQNYPQDIKYLQKNIWYPDELAKACLAKKQPKMVAFIKEKHRSLIGYLNPKFFDPIPEKVGVLKSRPWHFLAKPNVLPSDALKAALIGLSIIDCGMGCQMARYGALLDVLGETKFNRLFGKEVG